MAIADPNGLGGDVNHMSIEAAVGVVLVLSSSQTKSKLQRVSWCCSADGIKFLSCVSGIVTLGG